MSAVLLPERRTEMICVGKTFLAVCVMTGPLDGEARTQKRHFGTIVTELESLRDWLKQEGVTHVVMESSFQLCFTLHLLLDRMLIEAHALSWTAGPRIFI